MTFKLHFVRLNSLPKCTMHIFVFRRGPESLLALSMLVLR